MFLTFTPPSPSENSELSVFYSYSSLWKDPIFQFSRGNKTVLGQSPPVVEICIFAPEIKMRQICLY